MASVVDVRKFLSTPDKPVESQEMMDFWNSLTAEEKAAFKAELD